MTPKEENFIYHEMTMEQVIKGIDYFIKKDDEDSLLEVAEHFFKGVADKDYLELVTFLFDASSRFLTDKRKWIMKVNRRLMEIDKNENDTDSNTSPSNRQLPFSQKGGK